MPKQPATATDKKLATRVEGHDIQKPRLLDADNEREITRRNDDALVNYQADAGLKEVPAAEGSLSAESPTPDKTADVKEKKG